MTSDDLEDIKQLLQAELRAQDDRTKETLGEMEQRLIQRMDDGFGGASDALDHHQEQIDSLDQRVSTLEQGTA
jgi:hypothetical protein